MWPLPPWGLGCKDWHPVRRWGCPWGGGEYCGVLDKVGALARSALGCGGAGLAVDQVGKLGEKHVEGESTQRAEVVEAVTNVIELDGGVALDHSPVAVVEDGGVTGGLSIVAGVGLLFVCPGFCAGVCRLLLVIEACMGSAVPVVGFGGFEAQLADAGNVLRFGVGPLAHGGAKCEQLNIVN